MRNNKRIAEFRATLKGLTEQRAELEVELQGILDGAQAETRAMTEDENAKFDEIENKIKAIDTTIAAEERARGIKSRKPTKTTEETTEEAEIRAFANYVRDQAGLPVETRAGEQNITMGNNGAIIPVTIANRIIKAVKDICPIYAKATIYHVKGTLKVPVWGKANTTHDINVGYQQEFVDITADAGAFTSVDLTGFLAGALTLIGKSVINNGDVDVVNFIVSQMAEEIAAFLEKELLVGTAGKATGALSTTTTLTSASATAITADELIELQAKIKQVYQNNACWIMHPDTFTAVKKLKDSNQRYLLQDDYTSDFPYRLLGKPVYLSDNMPKVAAGAKSVLYGDLSGLSVNMREDVQIQILLEKYATQHAIGVVSWFEFDSKVTDNQKLATLVQKAA
jgi:HK97 family phage major capsid protein|uniref:Major capsid protein n=1 Tax=Siphoviridae sp. cthL03 TaxID=2825615 RepID=A0A8S5PGM3_9CAUD|nr:phage major capsid protein [uncultured Lachnoclostridium sp.]DAE05595.1 MAG TPA: major capsid protein [Siphoviridae sp. cthL03]